MRWIIGILLVICNFNLIAQEDGYSIKNYIPRVGKPYHETVVFNQNGNSFKVFKESYLDGLIQIYRHFRSDINIYIVVDSDTLFYDENQEILYGYETEFFEGFNYLIVSKNNGNKIQWSKGYYLGKDIQIQIASFDFVLKSGTVLSECRCKSSNNRLNNLSWIQFYDRNNIKRLQLYDEDTDISKNIEFYYGNKVAVIQSYISYLEHTDSIFNKKGELIIVYQYDSQNKLVSEESYYVNNLIYSLTESEFAWDYFYPFNHCPESQIGGN